MALFIDGIKKRFKDFVALEGVTLEVQENEFVCLVGPSGCGKTTLLRIIGGLEKPTEGSVFLNGNIVDPGKGDIGFIFQENSLFPWLTVEKNVRFGLSLAGLPARTQREIAARYIELVGLQGFENFYPQQLSGGMKQLASIARALAYNPRLLLMDEPFASLDAQTRNGLQRELLKIWSREKKTVIFVTHSIDEAVFLADRVVVISASPGKVKDVLTVEIPRPRKRTSENFNLYRERILSLIEDHGMK